MTGQDGRQDPARLAISPSPGYTRAGAYVNDPAPGRPARARIGAEPGKIAPPVAADEPVATPSVEPADQAEARPARYPLRRRGANIRDAGHAAYYDATTPWGGVVAAYDYARSASTRAATAKMPPPPDTDALFDAGRALMAVGDALTAAMHTWSPAS